MAERGLSQERLAKLSGVPKPTLHRWLTAKSEHPSHRFGVLSLAAGLGLTKVHTDRLLRAAGLPVLENLATSLDPDERALLARWSPPVRNNLPAELTSFVGRVDEVAEGAMLLEREPVRLVTLTGPGGSGKTRLALRVAREVLDAFPDGVFFVSLVAVSDPGLVMKTIAESVGLRDVLDASPRARLADWLRGRRVLLALDNLEHLIDSGPDIAGLLREAPGLTVLATSRVPLHVYGEHEWPVQPFPLPQRDQRWSELRANPAVDLFVQRAQAANPRWSLDDDLPAVAEICARLDGLPLAIELAAARVRERNPEALLADFPNPLDLTGPGPRDVPRHQQTLRDTIAWSVDLLPVPARILLARLSVFSGGWTEEAAEAVCASATPQTAPASGLLPILQEASLIEQASTPSGRTRYRMLETIREYSLERLVEFDEEAGIRARHAAYFLEFAESAPPYVPEKRTSDWYERVDEDLDNFRAALNWASAQDNPTVLARFAAALWPYWNEYLWSEEGLRWLDAVLPYRAGLPRALQASLLTGAATLEIGQSDYRAASECAWAALSLWRELDDHRGQALALQLLGWISYGTGDNSQAISLLELMVEQWRLVGDPVGIAQALSPLALAVSTSGNFATALPYLTEAQMLYRDAQDEIGLARSANDRGIHALLRGDVAEAIPVLLEAVDRLRALGKYSILPHTLFYLGTARCLAGQFDESLSCYEESLRIHEEREQLDDKFGLALIMLGFAAVAHRRGDGIRSATLCGAAHALQQAAGMALGPAVKSLYKREVRLVLDQIGPERFAEAFARGTELTEAEAVALVREMTADSRTSI